MSPRRPPSKSFEPETGEEEAYAELDDGEGRPIPELDFTEDCNVDGVVDEEGRVIVAIVEMGEVDAIDEVAIIGADEVGV